MKKFKLDRRGDIPSTLTWMIAFIIIFFLMFFLVLIVSMMKILPSGKAPEISVSFDEEKKTTLFLTEELIAFANTQVNENERLYDIIIKADIEEGNDERAKVFSEKAQEFLDINLPLVSKGGDYYRTWIRVYELDEELGSSPRNWKYEGFDVARGGRGRRDCIPDENAFVISLSLVNKKLVLCAMTSVN